MSVMKRVRDITTATLNDKLEKSEDPVKLIDSYLVSQREQLMHTQKLYKQCHSHTEAMRAQYLRALELAQKREQQAQVALRAGEEHIARLALQEKLMHDERAEQYKELYEEAKRSLTEIDDQLQELKLEYDDIIAKRHYYAARMESIRLKERMNRGMHGRGNVGGTDQAFRRLEDKINDWELETGALRDLRKMTQESIYKAGTAVKQTLEIELEKLKRKLEKEGWK